MDTELNFFLRYQHKQAPLLHSVYIESLQNGSLPPTLRQASIRLLLKKDKDPKLCSSCRPLSLINVDAKILAKALAHHLENILCFRGTHWIQNRTPVVNNIMYAPS